MKWLSSSEEEATTLVVPGRRQAAARVRSYFHTAEPAAGARLSIFIAQISSKSTFYFLLADKEVSFWQSTMDTHGNYISDLEI